MCFSIKPCSPLKFQRDFIFKIAASSLGKKPNDEWTKAREVTVATRGSNPVLVSSAEIVKQLEAKPKEWILQLS